MTPAVGSGQTSSLTAAQSTNASYSRQHRGSDPQSRTTPGTIQNDETEEFPSEKRPGNNNSYKLIKNDLNNITESEFRIIVIKLIAGLENSIQDSRESIATEIKGLRNSQEELKNVINELQNKMETTMARIEEAEERLGELEDKIMEKEEAEKREIKKSRSMRGKLEN